MKSNRDLESDPSTWLPKQNQNAKALRLFHDGMKNMNDALQFPLGAGVGQLTISGRKVSVELRKLLYDSKPLVHRVLQRTRFHPLRNKARLTGDVYENANCIQVAPGTKEGPLLGFVARQTWRITVSPLHGLTFNKEEKKWTFGPLFDTQAQSLDLGSWLNQRLFCVDGREYSVLNTLKYVSNKEAVHVDTGKDILAKDMERVHFGHTTYAHLVAIMTASYIMEQYKHSLQAKEQEWSAFFCSSRISVTDCKVIKIGEFDGMDIDPMGFAGEFHQTGISFPIPGQNWKPVQLEEEATVYA